MSDRPPSIIFRDCLEPPPSIEPGRCPGGVVFRLFIDGQMVDEITAATPDEADAGAERQITMARDATEHHRVTVVNIAYDGDDGSPIIRVVVP